MRTSGYFYVRFADNNQNDWLKLDRIVAACIERKTMGYLFDEEGFRKGLVYPNGEVYLG